MLHARGRFPALHAGQGYGIALDGILPGAVAFRDDGDFAAELLGWHVGILLSLWRFLVAAGGGTALRANQTPHRSRTGKNLSPRGKEVGSLSTSPELSLLIGLLIGVSRFVLFPLLT